MRKLGPAILLSVAVIIGGGWFLSSGREDTKGPPAETSSAPHQAEIPDIAEPWLPETVGLVRGAEVIDDPNASETSLESASARAWPVPPAVMESLIFQELAALRDTDISSIVSWECVDTACELRVISREMLTSLVGPDSEFSRKFSAEPYGAYLRVKSELIAPGTWEKTILLASNGTALQAYSASWPRAVEMSRRTADALLEGLFGPGSSPLSLGTTIDGVQLLGQNICSFDCPQDARRVIYIRGVNGQTCSEIDGTEWTTTALSDEGARSRSREATERTFCLPNRLIEY